MAIENSDRKSAGFEESPVAFRFAVRVRRRAGCHKNAKLFIFEIKSVALKLSISGPLV